MMKSKCTRDYHELVSGYTRSFGESRHWGYSTKVVNKMMASKSLWRGL